MISLLRLRGNLILLLPRRSRWSSMSCGSSGSVCVRLRLLPQEALMCCTSLFAETGLYIPCAVLDVTACALKPYTPRQS